MLTEDQVRNIYFATSPRPGAVLAVDVDYQQFAEKVQKATAYSLAKTVLDAAISECRTMNGNVADQLAVWAKLELKKLDGYVKE